MNVLIRIQDELSARWREALTVEALSQLSDRRLEDTRLSRRDIRRVARIAARSGADGAALADILSQLDKGEPIHEDRVGLAGMVQGWGQALSNYLSGPTAARARDI